jgi:hypothetical protein
LDVDPAQARGLGRREILLCNGESASCSKDNDEHFLMHFFHRLFSRKPSPKSQLTDSILPQAAALAARCLAYLQGSRRS